MMKRILVACLVNTLVMYAMAICLPEAESYDFQTEFCNADVVFRGFPRNAKSGTARNEDGREIAAASYNFQVDEYFKDTTGRRSNPVSVSHTYFIDDECPSLFSGWYNNFIVFAQGSDHFTATTCHFQIPWDCVPQAARDVFSSHDCSPVAA